MSGWLLAAQFQPAPIVYSSVKDWIRYAAHTMSLSFLLKSTDIWAAQYDSSQIQTSIRYAYVYEIFSATNIVGKLLVIKNQVACVDFSNVITAWSMSGILTMPFLQWYSLAQAVKLGTKRLK